MDNLLKDISIFMKDSFRIIIGLVIIFIGVLSFSVINFWCLIIILIGLGILMNGKTLDN